MDFPEGRRARPRPPRVLAGTCCAPGASPGPFRVYFVSVVLAWSARPSGAPNCARPRGPCSSLQPRADFGLPPVPSRLPRRGWWAPLHRASGVASVSPVLPPFTVPPAVAAEDRCSHCSLRNPRRPPGSPVLGAAGRTLCTKATMQTVRAADTNEVVKLIFRESDNDRKVMLQLEKKLFDYFNQEVFRDDNGTALSSRALGAPEWPGHLLGLEFPALDDASVSRVPQAPPSTRTGPAGGSVPPPRHPPASLALHICGFWAWTRHTPEAAAPGRRPPCLLPDPCPSVHPRPGARPGPVTRPPSRAQLWALGHLPPPLGKARDPDLSSEARLTPGAPVLTPHPSSSRTGGHLCPRGRPEPPHALPPACRAADTRPRGPVPARLRRGPRVPVRWAPAVSRSAWAQHTALTAQLRPRWAGREAL
ncbi:hypothetical protein J1605_003403 [Eschrichtius robustus]|uniref:Uncharacterized protein n=1 Tax=Eschrichtius robustus TaxID=9764 RepID=A0AB34HSC1_ESCRO|nr:hypothetical protein J1605_003403 [Eschrichtius robustus]